MKWIWLFAEGANKDHEQPVQVGVYDNSTWIDAQGNMPGTFIDNKLHRKCAFVRYEDKLNDDFIIKEDLISEQLVKWNSRPIKKKDLTALVLAGKISGALVIKMRAIAKEWEEIAKRKKQEFNAHNKWVDDAVERQNRARENPWL